MNPRIRYDLQTPVWLRRGSGPLRSDEADYSVVYGLPGSDLVFLQFAFEDRVNGGNETGVRLVACTKALHHLLPNLVVPMDRQFTGAFFGWNTHDWQTKEERLFKSAFVVFREIAHKARPSQYVGAGWNTGLAKVLDNAIAGYCRETQLDQASREKAVISRAKELGIDDEIVSEAKRRHQS